MQHPKLRNISGYQRQKAQAITEFLVVWPVLLLAVCLVLQLIIIWWAQQTLDTATQYAVRTGAVNHGYRSNMVTTLVSVMAGLKPQPMNMSKPVAALQAVAQQRQHFALYGRLQRQSPTDEQLRQFSQRRWDNQQQQYVREIAVDHYQARLLKNTDPAWQEARRLTITTQWCWSLRIPLAAELLGLIAKQQGQCLVGNYRGVPQWPLNSQASHEMLSGFRQDVPN